MNTLIDEEETENKTYTFDELDDRAKERALRDYAENALHDSWYEYVVEDWEKKLAELGYRGADIQFCGFWSQGGGASFTAHGIELDHDEALELFTPGERERWFGFAVAHKMSIGEAPRLVYEGRVKRTDTRYCHEHSVTVSGTLYAVTDEEGEVQEFYASGIGDCFDDTLTGRVRDLCREIYRDLEKEYEYQTGEESFRELAEVNGWRFSEDGELD